MKNKIFSFFVSLVLIFSTIPTYALASEDNVIEGDKIETIVAENIEQPQQPIITDDMPIEEANVLIDQYNTQVDVYNENVKATNAVKEKEYQEEVQKVEEHNRIEDEKVEQNQKDLEKQEKLDQKVAADSQSKLPTQTTNSNSIPTSWENDTSDSGNAKTITVEKNNSDQTYKVANLHIYVDEEMKDLNCAEVSNDNFYLSLLTNNHMILGEWEIITVGNNDIVTVYSHSALYPHSGALFLRRLEGYTNGYWLPSQEFYTTTINTYEDWTAAGPSTVFSYDSGTTDKAPIKNVLNIFTYSFLRYGAEPVRVEKYNPNYLEYPEEIQYLIPLDKIDRLKETQSDIINNPTTTDDPITSEITNETLNAVTTINQNNNTIMTANYIPNQYNNTQVVTTTITPQEKDTVNITDDSTPLTKMPRVIHTWALLNLVLTIMTILLAIKIPKEEDENNNTKIKKHNNIVQLLFGIFAMIVFIFTENVRNMMILTDQFTIIMFIIFICGLVFAILNRDKEEEREEEEWDTAL